MFCNRTEEGRRCENLRPNHFDLLVRVDEREQCTHEYDGLFFRLLEMPGFGDCGFHAYAAGFNGNELVGSSERLVEAARLAAEPLEEEERLAAESLAARSRRREARQTSRAAAISWEAAASTARAQGSWVAFLNSVLGDVLDQS